MYKENEREIYLKKLKEKKYSIWKSIGYMDSLAASLYAHKEYDAANFYLQKAIDLYHSYHEILKNKEEEADLNYFQGINSFIKTIVFWKADII